VIKHCRAWACVCRDPISRRRDRGLHRSRINEIEAKLSTGVIDTSSSRITASVFDLIEPKTGWRASRTYQVSRDEATSGGGFDHFPSPTVVGKSERLVDVPPGDPSYEIVP